MNSKGANRESNKAIQEADEKDASLEAQRLMSEFSLRTGLMGRSTSPVRYLWTDAFAVCNYLELYRKTKMPQHLADALALVDQVHHTLGKYSENDDREGWISGLDKLQGEKQPTLGGLRIGKKERERGREEPFDERREWDRDGQYFHYLTKWMHALDRVARATGESKYLNWSLELAHTAYKSFSFVTNPLHPRRMCWKMSVDLSRPLVSAMGQHDPLDGLITCMQLRATAKYLDFESTEPALDAEIAEFQSMCLGVNWTTHDPLGIGGLLTDCLKLTQLIATEGVDESDRLLQLLNDAESGLKTQIYSFDLNTPAGQRLAFRELGLSIGLHSLSAVQEITRDYESQFNVADTIFSSLKRLNTYLSLAKDIEKFWLDPSNRRHSSWGDHRDINSIMLATSLLPKSYPGDDL
jgi:hypothetical protein